MVNRACLLCSKYADERLLRRTTKNSHHTVVLLSSLVLFNAVDLKRAQKCYKACQRIRQRLCNQHYIDAAHFVASEMACVGMRFTTYVDQPRGVVVPYANEKDIPSHLVDSIEENAVKLNPELMVTARKVSEFLNFCLSRYPFDNLAETNSASFSEERNNSPTRKRCRSVSNIEVKPVSLVCAEPSTTEVIVVGSERHSDSDEKLFEEITSLLDKQFTIRGDRLLTLFRFCPNCGSKISSEKGSLVLLEDDSSPVVHYYCDSCPGKQCWYGA